MYKFVLSTDSTCDLYHDFVAENDIRFVSLTYTMEKDGVMTDGLDAFTEYSQYVDFYDQLRAGGFSRTSMLNYESHYSHFLKLAKEGAKDVLHFTISSGLSPTVTVAEKAAADIKKDYPDFNLLAVDSLSATIGQGALVRAALRLRNEGKTVQEAYDYVVDMQKHIQYAIFANDLYYLKRGGRVSAATALVGSALGIKPVLHVDNEGHLINVSKARGRKNSILALVDRMERSAIEPEKQTVFISHGDCLADAEFLAQEVRRRLHVPRIEINYVGPVIGAHSGPGTLALFFLGTER